MSKCTDIKINDELGSFINHQIQSGRYDSASEVIGAGLKNLRDKETKMAALREAINEGIESGPAQPFDFDEFIATRRHLQDSSSWQSLFTTG